MIGRMLGTVRTSPDWQASEFAIKCYASSMLAYYIALRIGLQNPYWAVTTCFITAAPQPLAGAIVAKAIYRVFGTLLGISAAVILVPFFVNTPIALSLSLSLWLGLCTYLSTLDRRPRSYIFLLAGYTASIVGFASVNTPGDIFNVAVIREQEIVLGILSTAFIHAAIFPRTLNDRLQSRMEQIVREAETWSAQALEDPANPDLEPAREKIALAVHELSEIADQMPFDTSRFLPSVRALNALQDQLTLLVAMASAVEDRLLAISRLNEERNGELAAVTANISEWLKSEIKNENIDRGADPLLQEIHRELASRREGSAWGRMLTINVLSRLDELVSAHRTARILLRYLGGPGVSIDTKEITMLTRVTPARSLHRDHLGAVWVGVSAGLVVFLGCLFWIATAWPGGAGAVLIAAVSAGLFGNMQGAPMIIRRFLWGVFVGVSVAALYGYVVLPRVTDPVMLALVLAPPLLVFGAVLSRPKMGLLGLAASLGFVNTVGFAAMYQRDFSSFVNSALGLMLGAGLSAVVFSLTQIGSAKLSAVRLLKAAYQDVAMRANRDNIDRTTWTSRMLDRIGLFSAMQFLKEREPGLPVINVLTDMRTGVLAGELRELRNDATIIEARTLDSVLAGIAHFYLGLDPQHPRTPSLGLLKNIDLGIDLLDVEDMSTRSRQGLTLLTGLRRNLFPSAPPYIAASA